MVVELGFHMYIESSLAMSFAFTRSSSKRTMVIIAAAAAAAAAARTGENSRDWDNEVKSGDDDAEAKSMPKDGDMRSIDTRFLLVLRGQVQCRESRHTR